jgi:hypothetical protein
VDDLDQARFLVTRNAAEENAIAWKGEESSGGEAARRKEGNHERRHSEREMENNE